MQSFLRVNAASIPSLMRATEARCLGPSQRMRIARSGGWLIPLVCLLFGTLASAQSFPSREYVYLGGRVVAIEGPQPGVAITPQSSNPGAASTSGQFQVTTTVVAATTWTATGTAAWLTFKVNGQTLSSMSGTVSASTPATITYQVAQNTQPGARTGSITVSVPTFPLMTFTVMQSGSGSYGFTIPTAPGSFSYASGTGSFQLNTTSSTTVNWAASSNATWVTVPIGSGPVVSGTPATINYQVVQNTSLLQRTTTITVLDPAGNPFNFTVNQAAAPPPNVPSVVSISPLGSTGTGAVFTGTFTDTNGPASITEAQMLIRPGANNGLYGGTCYVRWQKGTGAFALMNDAGDGWLQLGAAGGSTVGNTQCTLSATGSAVSTVGNNLIVAFNVSYFTQSYAYATPLSVFLQAKDSSGSTSTGLVLETTYLVAQLGYPALNVNVTPTGSVATEQVFNVTSSPTRPYDNVVWLTVLMNNLNNISDLTHPNNPNDALSEDEGACGFYFYVGGATPNFLLFGDGGIPYAGSYGSFGQATAIANSQCALNLNRSSAISNTYQNVNFNLDITANPNFKGAEQVSIQGYLLPFGTPYYPGGWEPLKVAGTWTPYSLVSSSAPPTTSQTVSPASGTGLSPVLTFTAYSVNGYDYISELDVWINSTPGGTGGCRLLVDAFSGNATFLNDDGSSSQARLGQATQLSNSKCTINLANVTLLSSGTNRVLTLPVVFAQAFSGVQNQYLRVTEKSGNTTGWVQAGTWTVAPISGTPSLGTLSPASGQGLNQAFTVSAADTAGAADLASVQLVVNSTASQASACAVTYVAAQNVFQLLNDAGSASAGAVGPGQAASVTNSQCTLSGTGSSVQVVGTTLTIVANLYFNPTFASVGGATKNVYVNATTMVGTTVTGGLTALGTWTVPSLVPTPTITSLNPTVVVQGGPAFTLTVNGTNFVSGAAVKWNGAALPTTLVNATQLTALVAANLIASLGTINVVVSNPGNVNSAASQLKIEARPTITSLSPTSATADSDALTLTVNGANYLTGTTVKWNGSALPTTFVSASKLTATVSASLIAVSGDASVTAVNVSGLASTAAIFSVQTSTPTITSISPSAIPHGSGATGVNVTGTGFRANSVVQFNGTPLGGVFISSTWLIGTVTSSQLAQAGSAQITVNTPGGGTSNAKTLTIQ